MKIKYQLVAFVLLIITSTMTSQAQNSDGQRLFLIIGQSNASGRDDNFDPNGLDLPSPDVLLFDDNETFVEATQPLCYSCSSACINYKVYLSSNKIVYLFTKFKT